MAPIIEVSRRIMNALNPEIYTRRDDLEKITEVDIGNCIVSPIRLGEQKEIYDEVLELKKGYKGFPGFDNYFEFDETNGIKGSNPFYMVLINKVLARNKERTPTFYEAMELEKKGKLTNNVYRDYGLAVLSNSEPNKELADKLISLAKKRGWKLPILAHFTGLDFDDDGLYKFTPNDSQVISGKKAEEGLKKFNYKIDSGVQRLVRNIDGSWGGNCWGQLYASGTNGRIDWKCIRK